MPNPVTQSPHNRPNARGSTQHPDEREQRPANIEKPMALEQWAIPELAQLLPLDEAELHQLLTYTNTLPDQEATQHLGKSCPLSYGRCRRC